MLAWFRRDLPCSGSILFPGPLPPRPEELTGLAARGLEVRRLEPGTENHWRLELRHPLWGTGELLCPRDALLPPRELVDWDPRLSGQEKAEVAGYGSAIWARVSPLTHDVLRDRKVLLRFLDAAMTPHGLFAMDHLAQSCWSRSALEDELRHDAALDIAALFTIHLLSKDESDGTEFFWLHSHGLKEIGFCDFDLIEPHKSCYQEGYDALRALAFAIVEKRLAADGSPFPLVQPGGSVQLVSARKFQAQAPKDRWLPWREAVDPEHLDGHAIVCEPVGRTWFGFGGGSCRPSRFFSGGFPDEGLIQFSTEATDLMAERARNTYPALRALLDELSEFALPVLVKLGYVVDGGGPNDREHLWFEVHSCCENEIEATLVNQPFHIERMRAGDRGTHAVELISDWRIMSPFGSITPAFGMALREVRTRPDELRRILAGGDGPGA